MAHFAKIENGFVTDVVVVDNEHEVNGEAFLNALGLEGVWVQTSYNANFGKKFAGIGDSYDLQTGFFKSVQPYSSWIFDEVIWSWVAPIEKPVDGKVHKWDESTLSWVKTI